MVLSSVSLSTRDSIILVRQHLKKSNLKQYSTGANCFEFQVQITFDLNYKTFASFTVLFQYLLYTKRKRIITQ